MKTNNLATLKERLHSAWACLTYKEFFLCAIKRRESGNYGAINYYSTLDTKEEHPFMDAVHELSDENSKYSFMNSMNI